jgi:hypothetical protein
VAGNDGGRYARRGLARTDPAVDLDDLRAELPRLQQCRGDFSSVEAGCAMLSEISKSFFSACRLHHNLMRQTVFDKRSSGPPPHCGNPI